MKYKWIGLVAVAAVVVAIVLYKQAPQTSPAESITEAGEEATPSVLLFADPDEADEVGGCGEIFTLVRAAAARGIPTLEIDPHGDSELIRTHRVVVSPTVILRDEHGLETVRHEGEDAGTIAAIEADLERLAAGPR